MAAELLATRHAPRAICLRPQEGEREEERGARRGSTGVRKEGAVVVAPVDEAAHAVEEGGRGGGGPSAVTLPRPRRRCAQEP